ncbi:MAG: polysaccharide pyruvyl transferase family protein [Lachnospiraceae bacterium]|nr:polysaccharide pyruvyl transferase family protein [Lachnospiraceae bacterium]
MRTILANTIAPLKKRKGQLSDCREMIQRCGANTGNVCFVDAMYQQLDFEKEVVCNDIDVDNLEDAVCVLPASNWINHDGKVLGQIFPRLKTTNVKLAVLGLGIQMELDQTIEDFIKGLSSETITALKIMSEHCACIGVRGGITGEILDRLSIHNWQIVGCPSFYEPYRKTGTITLKEPSAEKICYNTRPGLDKEHKLIEMALSAKAPIVLQAMSDLPLTLTEGRTVEQRLLDDRYPGAKFTAEELENYIRESGHIFYNRDDWSHYLTGNNVTFSAGGRFHGNMMAFSNGIPAVWIVHDIRGKELVDAMALPFIFYNALEDMNTPDKLLAVCKYDNKFVQNYKKMGEDYVNFLEKNGIRHTFGSAYNGGTVKKIRREDYN